MIAHQGPVIKKSLREVRASINKIMCIFLWGGSSNCSSNVQRQFTHIHEKMTCSAISFDMNQYFLSIVHPGTIFKIIFEKYNTYIFSLKRMNLKMSSAKYLQIGTGLDVFTWEPDLRETIVHLIISNKIKPLGLLERRKRCLAWVWQYMMTSSNGNIFRVTGHLCGEFTGPLWVPRTKACDTELWYFFDLRPNKRLNKQS